MSDFSWGVAGRVYVDIDDYCPKGFARLEVYGEATYLDEHDLQSLINYLQEAKEKLNATDK